MGMFGLIISLAAGALIILGQHSSELDPALGHEVIKILQVYYPKYYQRIETIGSLFMQYAGIAVLIGAFFGRFISVTAGKLIMAGGFLTFLPNALLQLFNFLEKQQSYEKWPELVRYFMLDAPGVTGVCLAFVGFLIIKKG